MLKVEHLTKVYPNGTVALKDLSFEVEDGEFLVIIGLSGSGKSTLLRCINRLIDPTEGKITMDGVDVTAAKGAELRHIRRHIGMIFQHFNLVKRSSVMTNVLNGRLGYLNPWTSTLGIFPHVEKQRAMTALDRVGIAEKASSRADALSGGQQQRLCIARALAVEPEVVLMDEPTSALDPISTGRIEDLCVTLREKYTIIIVTHNMQQAARISDNTAFFLLGEIIEYGNTEKLFSIPRDKRTEDYITGRFG